MKSVSELYGTHAGEDIYVVGSGTSMRVFPTGFLDGRTTIGLNMAWKNAPVTYGLTIGPHLNVPELMDGEEPRPEITWIARRVKAAAVLTPEQFEWADRTFYWFEIAERKSSGGDDVLYDGARVLDYVRRPTGDLLYQWSSISQTALNLAANMGARNVILVGCDNSSLLGNHHGHSQHTKWMWKEPDERYRQYYEGLVEVRTALRERGVNVVSMTPFLKLDDPALDFVHLCDELERPRLLTGDDISASDGPPPGMHYRPRSPASVLARRVVGRGRTAGRQVRALGRRLRPESKL